MILYLDASALVKRYVEESGSEEVAEAIARAEVAAAFVRAIRTGALTPEEAWIALRTFRADWPDLIRLQITEMVVARADMAAWEYGLRGYDAVHLATALLWQDAMGERVTLATFDQHLWVAAEQAGLNPYPGNPPGKLARK